MKTKILICIILFVAVFAAPSPVIAYTGVSGDVVDAITGDPWSWGGYVYIWNQTAGLIAGEGTFTGSSYNIPYSIQPTVGDQLFVYILADRGPRGAPPLLISPPYSETGITISYQVGTLVAQSGPNSVELIDFSVSPQTSNIFWLPFILLIGSVILVVGSVYLIRKRRI